MQDVALKTYRELWTIEKGSGRGSGRSVLARQDDDRRFGLVLWHINHFKLFNAKSTFMQINSSILNYNLANTVFVYIQ